MASLLCKFKKTATKKKSTELKRKIARDFCSFHNIAPGDIYIHVLIMFYLRPKKVEFKPEK